MERIEEQYKGNYPPLKRMGYVLGTLQQAWDAAKEGAGVYETPWTPKEIIRLRLRETLNTTIVFPEWETIETVLLGDEEVFTSSKVNDRVLLVRPKQFVGTDTSLTVIGGSGNIYGFYLRSEGYNSQNISDVMVYVKAASPTSHHWKGSQVLAKGHEKPSGKIPGKSSEKGGQKPESDWLETGTLGARDSKTQSFRPSQLNFHFSMSGDRELAPERVFSDGIFTFLDYGKTLKEKRLPAVSQVIDETDTPTQVTREGNMLVVRGHAPLTLRNGQQILCVYPTKEAE